MIAALWANQIVLGRRQYSRVPRLLREAVADLLTDEGRADLITEAE